MEELIINKVFSITQPFSRKGDGSKRINRKNCALIFKYEGLTIYINDGKKIISNGENLVFLPKGCSYIWNCLEEGRFFSIEFDGGFTSNKIISFNYPYKEKLLKIFYKYQKDITNNFQQKQFIKNKYGYEILYNLLTYKNDNYLTKNKKDIIKMVIEYINLNLDKNLNNELLANYAKVSTSYFRNLFMKSVGISPMQYVNKLRMEKAKEILFSDYGNISSVALSVGFENVYYFSNAFKKYFGSSPLNYLKNNKYQN